MGYPTAWGNDILMPRIAENGSDIPARREILPDNRLVELALAGDEMAFEQMFDRYKRLAGAAAARYFQQPEQIEEIIQMTFAKVFFELKNFRGGNDFSLASWIGRIATNICLNMLRTKKCRAESQLGDVSKADVDALFGSPEGGAPDPEILLMRRDLAEKLLARLAAEDRALLQMMYVEEKNTAEIAAITGWSTANVKVRAYRARRMLRKILHDFV
jgi:RNA polymerase sigma-70 factor (ECF subfamily)